MLHCITAESINFNRRLEKYNLLIQDYLFSLWCTINLPHLLIKLFHISAMPLPDTIYCAQQIHIPPQLPDILKNFTKAAIRTQPKDVLQWSEA